MTITSAPAAPAPPRLPAHAPAAGLGYLLRWAHVRSARTFNAALVPLGIEGKHFGVLSFLTERPRSQRQLVDLTDIDKASMVRIIDELESRGLVRRDADPADRRAHAVTLTDQGRQVLAEARAIARQVADSLLAHMAPDHREQLRDLLAEFVSRPAHAGER